MFPRLFRRSRSHVERYRGRAVLVPSLLMLSTALALVVSCDERQGNVAATTRVEATVVEPGDRESLSIFCQAGESLVGGGYGFREPPLDLNHPPIIEASYPLGAAWRVTVLNPSDGEDGVVFGYAYCLRTPGLSLSKVIRESAWVEAAYNNGSISTVSCPANSIALSGGFQVKPDTDESWDGAGLYNAYLTESLPTTAGGNPTGWRVRQHFFGDFDHPPSTKAYVLCANQGLEEARVVTVRAERRSQSGFLYFDGRSPCEAGEFVFGGGFQFSGDPLIPHVVYQNTAVSHLSVWEITSIYGFETGSSGVVNVSAICTSIPRYIAVRIVQPTGLEKVQIDPSNPDSTPPLAFNAQASDTDGNPLSGASLQWTRNGVNFGTGESFTSTLPAPPPGTDFIDYLITVTATDSDGLSASDSVHIFVFR